VLQFACYKTGEIDIPYATNTLVSAAYDALLRQHLLTCANVTVLPSKT